MNNKRKLIPHPGRLVVVCCLERVCVWGGGVLVYRLDLRNQLQICGRINASPNQLSACYSHLKISMGAPSGPTQQEETERVAARGILSQGSFGSSLWGGTAAAAGGSFHEPAPDLRCHPG